MMKKYLAIALAALAIVQCVQARVDVRNSSIKKLPIMFRYYWIGNMTTPGGSKDYWQFEVPWDKVVSSSYEIGNIKRRYVIAIEQEHPSEAGKTDIDFNTMEPVKTWPAWVVKYDKPAGLDPVTGEPVMCGLLKCGEWGNRYININLKDYDMETGEANLDVTTATI